MLSRQQTAPFLKAIAVAAALASVAPAQAQDAMLSPADIQSQWVGKTVFVKVANGALAGRDRKSTRLNSSHRNTSRMPSSA